MLPARLAAILITLLSHTAPAQSAARFASVDLRISLPGIRESNEFLPDGSFECRGMSVVKLIDLAYGVPLELVLGGEPWLDSDRWDISARPTSPGTSQADLKSMLRTLLADRFALRAHPERKQIEVYLLHTSKKGVQFQTAAAPGSPDCPRVNGLPELNHRACQSYSMAALTELLPRIARNYIRRPVWDETNLTGAYDFQLDWMDRPRYLEAKAHHDHLAISIFDALENLGLRLELAKRPADTVVIDSATEPSMDFEVVESRASRSGVHSMQTLPTGELDILGYTGRELIAAGFGMQPDRILGGPSWLDTDSLDMIAKPATALSSSLTIRMLQRLVISRLKLTTHLETRPVDVLALKQKWRSQNLQHSDPNARSQCFLGPSDLGRAFDCRNTTLAQLAERLPGVARAYITRPLVDTTQLQTAYDFVLAWTPKDAPPPPNGEVTVFEALERQLGLRLEEQNHSMPVLVIDQADRP